MEQREICIEDISNFVEHKSRSLGNPILGKLPCMEKKASVNKEKRLNPRNDKPGSKKLSLATITEKNSDSQVRPVSSSTGSKFASAETAKGCLFCHASHHLSDCSDFAKASNQDCFDFVMKKRLCFACLRAGYQPRGCQKRKPCHHCSGPHATVMHVEQFGESQRVGPSRRCSSHRESLRRIIVRRERQAWLQGQR